MLFFVKSHIKEFKGLSSNEIQNLVQKEIAAISAAKAAGKIVAAYHASEQP